MFQISALNKFLKKALFYIIFPEENKSFSKQLGSTLAHIQDLFDTIVQGLLRSKNKGTGNKVVDNVRDAGESYYKTYENIKKGKERS